MSEEDYDIKEEAKQLLKKNKTIISYIGEEKIEDVFTKIYIPDTQEEFSEMCDSYSLSVDGFNKKDYICISPYTTPYTVIREVLQYIASEFDLEGYRTKNGIAQDRRNRANSFKLWTFRTYCNKN